MFENILLEQDQRELLVMLVEAARNVPQEKRQQFMFQETIGGESVLFHPGLPAGKDTNVYKGDIDILLRNHLLLGSEPSHTAFFDIAPLGFKYYEHLKTQSNQPVQRIAATIREYVSADQFQQKYPTAYQKWAQAEELLWKSDSPQQLTTIGHLCREAIQEFVSTLVEIHQPPNVDTDKAHTVARLKAVLNVKAHTLGTTVPPFHEALFVYLRTLSDLIQRQEHGGQKEGEPLVWKDGQRVVFQSANLMFELDNTFS